MKTKNTKINHPSILRILEYLGQNIKLARLRRHITAIMLAERAGISRTTLQRIERGEPRISIGLYANVLHSSSLEKDLEAVAKDDILGRKLQDIELLQTDDLDIN